MGNFCKCCSRMNANNIKNNTVLKSIFTSSSTKKIAGVNVTVAWPPADTVIRGVTFLLPGALVSLSEYESTSNVLLDKGQVVLSFFINVLSFTSHDTFADRVFQIFQEFHGQNPHLPDQFNVVGHSVGGKIALLVPTQKDTPPKQVNLIFALDPVDERPAEFTNNDQNNATPNRTFEHAAASTIYIAWATATPPKKIDPAHNAEAIFNANAHYLSTPLLRHDDAGHFAYTDHGGGLPGWLIQAGTPQGNKAARDDVHEKIRKIF